MSESVFPYNHIEEMKEDSDNEKDYVERIEYEITESLEAISNEMSSEYGAEAVDSLNVALTAFIGYIVDKLEEAIKNGKKD